jgi:hypothetical protein
METTFEGAKQMEHRHAPWARTRGSSPPRTVVHPLFTLQQQAGNQAVQRLVRVSTIQAKLAVTQPGDQYEQEADHVAEQVTRVRDTAAIRSRSHSNPHPPLRLQRSCGCAGFSEKCESCQERDEGILQSKAARSGAPAAVPPIVQKVLRSPGNQLDSGPRAFFESRLGHDFSGVRVHTDALAGRSARAVGALAYTVGPHLVFAPGYFDPQSAAGEKLLAHELTHVVQQRSSDVQSVLSRQAAEAEPDVDVEEDVEPEHGVPLRGPRYAPIPEHQGFGALAPVNIKQAIGEAEIPVATLMRGGKAPGFVTFEGTKQIRPCDVCSLADAKQNAFHILDAIEYAVGRANTNDDLAHILQRFIPTIADFYRLPISELLENMPFRVPPDLDPDGAIRIKVFDDAVAKRKKESPMLARQPALDVVESNEKNRRRRCTIERRRGSLGNDPLATTFCQYATGSLFEYRITSPLYGSVDADAVRGNTMSECKCGYASFLRGLSKDKWYAKLQEDGLTEQMLRHQRIVRDCGLNYQYVVSNPEFANFLRGAWPGIDIVHVPWEPCD